MKARRTKGLCYWCPERYTISHVRKGRQIFLIEVGEDDQTGFDQNMWTIKKQGIRSKYRFMLLQVHSSA